MGIDIYYTIMVKTVEPQVVKHCRIKTEGLIRYQKEYNSYENEVKKLEEKLKQVESEGDQYDIKRWKEVLDDTTQMLPNVKGKIEQNVEDLEMYLEEYEEDEELKASEELLDKPKTTILNIRTFLDNLENEDNNEVNASAGSEKNVDKPEDVVKCEEAIDEAMGKLKEEVIEKAE